MWVGLCIFGISLGVHMLQETQWGTASWAHSLAPQLSCAFDLTKWYIPGAAFYCHWAILKIQFGIPFCKPHPNPTTLKDTFSRILWHFGSSPNPILKMSWMCKFQLNPYIDTQPPSCTCTAFWKWCLKKAIGIHRLQCLFIGWQNQTISRTYVPAFFSEHS